MSFSSENFKYKTFVKMIDELSIKYPNKLALVCEEEKLTYDELNSEINKLTKFFIEKGLNKGEKVILQIPNSILYVETLFALMKIGAIPVLVSKEIMKKDMDIIYEEAEATWYIGIGQYNKEHEEMLLEISNKVNSDENLIFEDILNSKRKENIEVTIKDNDIKPEDIPFIILSGGTTGTPKMVARTHAQYLNIVSNAAKRVIINENDVYLSITPTIHIFGLAMPGIMGTFYMGGTVVICDEISPIDILTNIEKESVTYTSMVPTIVKMCIEYLKVDNSYNISSLNKMVVGGAMITNELAKKATEMFKCKIIQGYGCTEGVLFLTDPEDKDVIDLQYQGKVCDSSNDIKIVDRDGNEVGPCKVGELIAKGPSIITSYYNNSNYNKSNFTKDGYYKSGDECLITKEGYIKIIGRIGDIINRGGEKILPTVIENAIKEDKKISECKVIGVEDSVLGQRIACFIETIEKDLDLKYINKLLVNKGIATFALADQLCVLNKLPLTTVGKLDKRKLISIAKECY